MFNKVILVLSIVALVRAQVPSLGWCPEYVPMANFDMAKYLGVWYEAERYFQLSEIVSRCVKTTYTKGHDNKLRVSNEVTNRFTGIKRILEGEIKAAPSKAEEGKLNVKYTTLPSTPETQYAVLETDYDNYAVLWSCNRFGIVHAQSAWILTRSLTPPGEVLQKAYGVLDKYKISKTFFVKSDQEDCTYLDAMPQPELPPVEMASNKPEEDIPVEEVQNLRSAIIPDAPEIIIQTRKAELAEKEKEKKQEKEEKKQEKEAPKPEVLKAEPEKMEPVIVEDVKQEELKPETVPEVILKTAEAIKETIAKEPVKKEDEPAKEVQAPFVELPKIEAPHVETPKIEAPHKELPKIEAAIAEPEKKEEPAKEIVQDHKEEKEKIETTKS